MKLRGLCMPLWLSSSGVYLFLESLALPCFALGPTGTAMAKLERFHQAHPDRVGLRGNSGTLEPSLQQKEKHGPPGQPVFDTCAPNI